MMKRAIICLTTLALCLSAVIAMAQQAAAPAKAVAPAAAPAASPAAPAAAAPAAAPAKPTAAAAGLTISVMEVAASVENRAPVGVAAAFPAAQEKVLDRKSTRL